MKYVLYAKQTCPFCIKAQEFFVREGKEFKVVNFEENHQNILQDIKEAYDWPTVPIIFEVEGSRNIRFVGGYTDLIKHLDGR
jgi:glutaredoxin